MFGNKEWKYTYLSRGCYEHNAGIISNYFFHIFPFFLMWDYKKWPEFPVGIGEYETQFYYSAACVTKLQANF